MRHVFAGGNPIGACALAIVIWGAAAPLRAQLNAGATVTPTQVNSTTYHYELTLKNQGTTAIGTFWFSWVPGYDLMPSAPSNVKSPASWSGTITHSPGLDGYGIEWQASGPGSYLAAGQSLTGFSFDSSLTPAQLGGSSNIYIILPMETSYVYSVAPPSPLSDPGFNFLAVIAQPPTAVPSATGVSPAAGGGTTGTFTFTFSDTGGFQSLTVLNVLINNVLDGRQACYVAFVPSSANAGSVFLVDNAGDAGGPFSGMALPGVGSVSNSQCSITGTGSSVSSSGNTLTLMLAITLTPGFAGNKVLYLSAQDASSNSGWQALGTWNNPGAAVSGPGVGGVSPARTNGLSQSYTFTFTDSNGWQDVTVADVLINSAITGVNACYVAFVPAGAGSGAVYLVDNAGDAGGPYAGMVLPASGTVSNGQCTISGAGSSVTASGNTLMLTLAITFSQGFAGNQVLYLAARSNTLNSGWQALGSVTVP